MFKLVTTCAALMAATLLGLSPDRANAADDVAASPSPDACGTWRHPGLYAGTGFGMIAGGFHHTTFSGTFFVGSQIFQLQGEGNINTISPALFGEAGISAKVWRLCPYVGFGLGGPIDGGHTLTRAANQGNVTFTSAYTMPMLTPRTGLVFHPRPDVTLGGFVGIEITAERVTANFSQPSNNQPGLRHTSTQFLPLFGVDAAWQLPWITRRAVRVGANGFGTVGGRSFTATFGDSNNNQATLHSHWDVQWGMQVFAQMLFGGT